ncbi:MAG: bile acid:sodium symporter family protein [Pirellulales bacterium]
MPLPLRHDPLPNLLWRWFTLVLGVSLVLGGFLGLMGMFAQQQACLWAAGFLWLVTMLAALVHPQAKDYRFTLWILIANLAALMVPGWFHHVGGLSLTDPWLLLLLVQLIMFGMGTQMHVQDFVNVLKMPGMVILGVCCQFLIMPIVGYALARVFPFSPEIGAGIILIGSCSSGLASNVMTYMARGNLALSVTLTSITTMLAPIATPMWMGLLAGSMVELDIVKMSLDIVKMVLVPILAAFVHDFLTSKNNALRSCARVGAGVGLVWLVILSAGGWNWIVDRLAIQDNARWLGLVSLPGFVAAAFVFGVIYHLLIRMAPAISLWMPRLSMFGIVYYTLVGTSQGRDQLLDVGFLLLIAVALHNGLGYFLGYWSSRILGASPLDARTIAIEVGLQNGAMATGLARSMDKLGTVGLAAILFSPLMNISGSLLANYWRRRPWPSPTNSHPDANLQTSDRDVVSPTGG